MTRLVSVVAVALVGLAPAAQASAQASLPSAPELTAPLPSASRAETTPTADDIPLIDGGEFEAALQLTIERFDWLLFIEASRSAMSGVFELYCGIGMLIPDRVGEGPDGGDIGLGAGCLVGAAANIAISALRISAANDGEEERDRLQRFRAAARDGLDDDELDLFEAELEDGASNARLRRGLSIGMGVALIVASGILIGFTSAEEVNQVTGITISTALGLAGLTSLVSLFVEAPYEAATDAFRAARER